MDVGTPDFAKDGADVDITIFKMQNDPDYDEAVPAYNIGQEDEG